MQHEPIYYLKKYKKPLFVWGGIVAILLLIVGIAAWQQALESRRGKLPIIIKTAPADAHVTIDGTTYQQGKNYITPGEYTAYIRKDGFHTTTQKIRINQNTEAALYAGLAPESDEAKEWQERHVRAYAEIERLGFQQSQAYGKKLQERWPIVASLPIKDPYFTISYKNIDDENIVLTIRGTSARYRELAIEQLRIKGFEPTNYKIEFIGFSNPLQEDV